MIQFLTHYAITPHPQQVYRLDDPDLNIKHELHMFKQIKTNGWLQ